MIHEISFWTFSKYVIFVITCMCLHLIWGGIHFFSASYYIDPLSYETPFKPLTCVSIVYMYCRETWASKNFLRRTNERFSLWKP